MVAVVCFVACSFATKRVLCQLESQFQGFEQPELANLKGPHCSPVCQPFWPPSQNVASSPPTFGSGSPSISMPQESRPTFRLERWLNLFGRRPLAQVETLPILSPSLPPSSSSLLASTLPIRRLCLRPPASTDSSRIVLRQGAKTYGAKVYLFDGWLWLERSERRPAEVQRPI